MGSSLALRFHLISDSGASRNATHSPKSVPTIRWGATALPLLRSEPTGHSEMFQLPFSERLFRLRSMLIGGFHEVRCITARSTSRFAHNVSLVTSKGLFGHCFHRSYCWVQEHICLADIRDPNFRCAGEDVVSCSCGVPGGKLCESTSKSRKSRYQIRLSGVGQAIAVT